MFLFKGLAEVFTNLPNEPSKNLKALKCNGRIVNDYHVLDEGVLVVFQKEHAIRLDVPLFVRIRSVIAKKGRGSTDGMASHGCFEFSQSCQGHSGRLYETYRDLSHRERGRGSGGLQPKTA